jgi:DNA-binding GntR family transcriptional regulator
MERFPPITRKVDRNDLRFSTTRLVYPIKPPVCLYNAYIMQQPTTLQRSNLRDVAVDHLRQMIVDGRLKAGERINEVQLAASLGISRTPIREALSRLVSEGALTSRARSGFHVCPLSREELDNLYPIRGLLDPEALRLAGIPSEKRLSRLESLNRKLEEATEPENVLKLDDDWHRELIADCPNYILLELIEEFIRRTRRYELALMREKREILRAVDEHIVIMRALRKGNLEAACAGLKRNMQSGKAAIVAWLTARQSK